MYNTEYCEVRYIAGINVVFVKWKKFCCGNDYREPLLISIDIMKEHEGCNFVCDTTDGFEDAPEDAQWIVSDFIPKTALTSCKIVFFIIEPDSNLKEEIEGHSTALGQHFRVCACRGWDEVKDILAGAQKATV